MTYEEMVKEEYDSSDWSALKVFKYVDGMLIAAENGAQRYNSFSSRPRPVGKLIIDDPATMGCLISLIDPTLLYELYGDLSMWCQSSNLETDRMQRAMVVYQFLALTARKQKEENGL